MREGNELEAFWKRLETKRGSSALTIQDAWTGLKDMGRALAQAQRWKTLSELLLPPQDEGGTEEQEQEASSEGGQERWEASSEAGQAQVDDVVHRYPADQCGHTFGARGREARS